MQQEKPRIPPWPLRAAFSTYLRLLSGVDTNVKVPMTPLKIQATMKASVKYLTSFTFGSCPENTLLFNIASGCSIMASGRPTCETHLFLGIASRCSIASNGPTFSKIAKMRPGVALSPTIPTIVILKKKLVKHTHTPSATTSYHPPSAHPA